MLELDPFRSRPKSESQADAGREAIESESNLGLSAMASSTAVPSEVPQVEIPISAIVTGGKRSAALIGDRLFYENDLLENG